MMIDWADVMRQIGQPVLLPSVLPEGLVLPPSANDGVPAPLSAIVRIQHGGGEEEPYIGRAVRERHRHHGTAYCVLLHVLSRSLVEDVLPRSLGVKCNQAVTGNALSWLAWGKMKVKRVS